VIVLLNEYATRAADTYCVAGILELASVGSAIDSP
jgi:hypothetical protein